MGCNWAWPTLGRAAIAAHATALHHAALTISESSAFPLDAARFKKAMLKNLVARFLRPTKTRWCPVCNSQIRSFSPLPSLYQKQFDKYKSLHRLEEMETLNLREYLCSNCGASDRERLYALYISEYLNQPHIQSSGLALLDIAPAAPLRRFIQAQAGIRYRSADLFMPEVDDRVDVTNMHHYRAGQFDFIICSHVLEHVKDDIQAVRELRRVLVSGGQAIVMVPINLNQAKTLHDPSVTGEAERWRLYGQGDHVRAYSKANFITLLSNEGFYVQLLDVNHFGAGVFEKSGIGETAVLYLAVKIGEE